jgi:hypothetical protein
MEMNLRAGGFGLEKINFIPGIMESSLHEGKEFK